jgi:uncharacterized membrane protein
MNSFHWTSILVRLICAGLIGVAAFVLSFQLEFDLRILLSYDLAISTYLAILLVRMAYADSGISDRNRINPDQPSGGIANE